MISGGVVRGNLESIKSLLSKYSSYYGSLTSSWKGLSSGNFMQKAEDFASEYQDSLIGSMNAFADACDDYEIYLSKKTSLEISEENYNKALKAVNSGNTGEIDNLRKFEREVSDTKMLLNELKEKINSNLATASASQLTASVVSTSGSLSASSNTVQARFSTQDSYVNGAINWALGIANDDSHGYSQQTRFGNPNYDCSSLVINAWESTGIPVKENGASYTGDMREAFLATGQFEWISGNPSLDDLETGDVLLKEGVHTELYIGNGQNVGAMGDEDGYDGDSSGNEICVVDYYSLPWDGILRYKEKENE